MNDELATSTLHNVGPWCRVWLDYNTGSPLVASGIWSDPHFVPRLQLSAGFSCSFVVIVQLLCFF